MPQQQMLPTWLAINNANFATQSGIQDLRTGLDFPAGGLNLGDYFDVTTKEANSASYLTNGLLYAGRYRLVQVDSGATAANVKVGTVGYARVGSSVASVDTVTQGTGQTLGTYNVAGVGGGGTGAIIQVVVTASNAITVTLINGGIGYTSVPTFTLATGGTPGTVTALMSFTPNVVTSFDIQAVGPRPVVFLNSITPGNYGFIQELGIATVLGSGTVGTATAGNFVFPLGGGAGAVTAGATYVATVIGQAIDIPIVSNPYKVLLNGPTVQD